MDSELDEILYNSFAEHVRDIKGGFYKGVWLPQDYLKISNDVENFKVRDDDVWVCSFPRSGNWYYDFITYLIDLQ